MHVSRALLWGVRLTLDSFWTQRVTDGAENSTKLVNFRHPEL